MIVCSIILLSNLTKKKPCGLFVVFVVLFFVVLFFFVHGFRLHLRRRGNAVEGLTDG